MPHVRTNISISPNDQEIARRLGSGNVSRGIRIALRAYAQTNPIPEYHQLPELEEIPNDGSKEDPVQPGRT